MATCEPRDFPACHPADFPGYRPDPLDCKRAIEQCFTQQYGAVQIGGYTGVGQNLAVRAPTLSQAITKLATGPQFFRDIFYQDIAATPRELFPGAILLANLLTSVGASAAGVPTYVTGAFTTSEQLARQKMSLNLGGLLGGIGSAVGGIDTSGFGNISGLLGGGLQIAGAAFTPAAPAYPVNSYGPVYGPVSGPAPMPQARGIPVSANVPATRQPQMTGDVFNAASKMLQALGIAPPSVASFYSAAKRALSALASLAKRTPSGTLVSLLIGLGLAANEAGVLTGWWATKSLRRRRMNAGNAKALRRAARRIKSFHNLCRHTDLLRGPGQRRYRMSRGRGCRTCRKSPCIC